jgi:hypothetical protein
MLDVTPCGFGKKTLSEEGIASIIRVTRIGELGTTLAVTSNQSTLRRNITVKTSNLIWNNLCSYFFQQYRNMYILIDIASYLCAIVSCIDFFHIYLQCGPQMYLQF